MEGGGEREREKKKQKEKQRSEDKLVQEPDAGAISLPDAVSASCGNIGSNVGWMNQSQGR